MHPASSNQQVPFVSVEPSSTDYIPIASLIRTSGCKSTNSFADFVVITTLNDGAIITLTNYKENNVFVVKGTGEYTVYKKVFDDATSPVVVAYLNSASGPSQKALRKIILDW